MFVYFPMLVLAYIAGMTLAWNETRRLGISQRAFLDMSLCGFLAALFGSKLAHVLFDGFLPYYLRNPWEVLIVWRGGQVFYGGLICGLGAALIIGYHRRVPFWKTLDALAPAIMLGLAIGRIGCVMAGCCFGKATLLPWGIQYGVGYPATRSQIAHGLISPEARYSLPIHPTQLYESGFALLLCIMGILLVRRRALKEGVVFIIILNLYAVGRFCIEFLRADQRGSIAHWLSTSQAISLGIILLSAIGWIWLSIRTTRHQHICPETKTPT